MTNQSAVGPGRAAGKIDGTQRIRGFGTYFKQYMGVSAIVVASLPVPAASFHLIPAYSAQRSFLGIYSSLFAFLILGFVFYSRFSLASLFFVATDDGWESRPGKLAAWCPMIFILCSLAMVFLYHADLDASIADRRSVLQAIALGGQKESEILDQTPASEIPHAALLIALYLAFFLSAEAAFVVMTLREYLQDLLGIRERDLLGHLEGPKVSSSRPDFRIDPARHAHKPRLNYSRTAAGHEPEG